LHFSRNLSLLRANMQYYTTQQLQGAQRYTGKCRIGNWNEDTALEDIKLMNYLKKKQSGGLAIDAYNKRVQTALAPQYLSVVRNDGFLHIGDCIQVKSMLEGAKGAVLSVDLRDSDPRPGEESYTVAGSVLYSEPNARNTFIIRKVTQTKSSKSTPVVQYDDDFLHYGQQIRLRLNPSVQGLTTADTGEETDDALFLRSLPISPQNFSKVSKSQ
jgi:hypothetical protein